MLKFELWGCLNNYLKLYVNDSNLWNRMNSEFFKKSGELSLDFLVFIEFVDS